MPRRAKTQAPAAPQDQAYGQRGEQIAAQNQLPLPDERGPVGPPPAPAAGGAPPLAPPPPPDPLAAAMAMAPPPPDGQLTAPTERPWEPVTAGLPLGDGPGPESIPLLAAPQRQTPAARALAILAAANDNDPNLARLAEQARARRQ